MGLYDEGLDWGVYPSKGLVKIRWDADGLYAEAYGS